jgi:hypothetical protein
VTLRRSTAELTREAQDWGDARPKVFLDYYTGYQPASADTAPSGTLLVTLSKSGAYSSANDGFSFGTATGGVIARTAAESVYGTAADSGTVGWARLRAYADAGTTNTSDLRQDYSVGLAGSGADIIVSSNTVTSGTVYPMGDFTHTCSNI